MIQAEKNITGRRMTYKVRTPYTNIARHINDVYLNQGYKYSGNVMRNGTSPELWANPQQAGMLNRIEGIIVFLIEQAKMIKKQFSIAHDKDTTNIQ